MDIKGEIEKLVSKVTKDSSFKEKFMKDPAGTVRGVVGDKADDETVKKIVETVKGAISGGKLGEIGDKIGGLFGKKDDSKKD